MNANTLPAAAAAVGHGDGVGVLALLVLAALGYGTVRLTHRSRPPHPAIKPGPPAPPPSGPAPAPIRRAPAHSKNPDGGWAVETHGLTKRFGATTAVDGVELLVPRGSAFGYLGPNGAGKTTLIRTLLGLTKANDGTMSLLGIPVPPNAARRWPGSGPSSTNPASTPT
jgi:ABC-type multidrug transport system fused ATPase/permease subunit